MQTLLAEYMPVMEYAPIDDLARRRQAMPLINFSMQHGRSLDEARRSLETAVCNIQSQFSSLLRQVDWSADRSQVRLDGTVFWVEIWVDAQLVYIRGDILGLGGLLSGPLGKGLQQIIEQTFQKRLR